MAGGRLPRLTVQSEEMLRLDALRIIASVAIVVYHYKAALDLGPGAGWLLDRLQGLHAAVDLFFFISGFVISRYYSGLADAHAYRQFVWKRFARLYPLHLATLLAFLAIGVAAGAAGLAFRNPEQFDLACLPANLALVHALAACPHLTFNQPSWSISAEMTLYVCFPLVLALRRRPAVALAVGVVALALIARWGGVGGRPWYEWTWDLGVLRAAPSFLLGAVAYDYRATLARLPFAEPGMWLALLAACALMLAGGPSTALVLTLYGVVLLGIAADGSTAPSRVVRALAPWGTLTYSLYLIHPLVDIVFISMLGRKILHLGGWALDLWVLLAIGVAFALAYLSFFWFEGPSRRWLSGLGARRPRRAAADLRTPL